MRAPALFALLLFASPVSAGEPHDGPSPYDGFIVLRGQRQAVVWSDGDSFEFQAGPRKGNETRLIGYNTLESYGPAHRWGDWTAEELWGVSKVAPRFAAKHEWLCTTKGDKDGYGRLLVDCPDLRTQLVKRGLGHVFAYDAPADPALLELQKEARLAARGMWSKGLPEEIVTAVHNVSASKSGAMRVVDTRTGATRMEGHEVDLKTCQEICHGDKWRGSCMIFVPYEQRYGKDRAECLRGEPPPWPPKEEATAPAHDDAPPADDKAPAAG